MHHPVAALRRRALLASGLAAPAIARAQTVPWQPDRPIRLLVGFPPGGPTDFAARLAAPYLAAALGQQVVIENRGGANGTLATDAVAKSAPDGHTLLFSGNNIVMNTALYRLPYDMVRDFAPVGLVAFSPNVLWSGPEAPFRTLDQLVAAARARPGVLTYATTGNGGNGHFGGETLKRALAIDITHVPYRGSALAVQDVVAGQVAMSIDSLDLIGPQIRDGRIRGLAVTSTQEQPYLPGLPPVATALPGYEVTVFNYLAMRAGTPDAIIQRLSREVRQIVQGPAFVARNRELGTVAEGSTPEELGRVWREEYAKWRDVITRANIRVE